jgi:hypothetical protein
MISPPDSSASKSALPAEVSPASSTPAIIEMPGAPLSEPPKAQRRGRHFGPRPVADPRSARLDMRCTRAVRAKAETAAKAQGISVAGYVASLIDDRPAPRVHRNPSETMKLLAQILGQMGKRGSNLNQAARALNEISRASGDGERRDRLADRIEETAQLHRQAVAEHRACVAAIMRALGLRPDADHH